MNKKKLLSLSTGAVLLLGSIGLTTYHVAFADIDYTVKQNNTSQSVKAPRHTDVKTVLEKAGVDITSNDRVSHKLEDEAKPEETIEVSKARELTIKDGTETKTILTTFSASDDILANAGITINEKDKVEWKDDTLVITRITVNVETIDEVIPFETREEEDENLTKGESVVETEGKDGIITKTQNVVYENGIKTTTTTIDKKVTDPVTKIVRVGTKKPSSASNNHTSVSYGSVNPSVRLSNGNTAGSVGVSAAQEMARRTGVSATTWETIIARESNGNPNAYNPSGASGLFQTMPFWGSTATVSDQIEAATRAYNAQGLAAWGF